MRKRDFDLISEVIVGLFSRSIFDCSSMDLYQTSYIFRMSPTNSVP